MNIRHAYSKEDPNPDERLLWGALVDDVDALALLRIGYSAGQENLEAEIDARVEAAEVAGCNNCYNDGFDEGFNAGLNHEDAA
ncbi:hypothetical protein [Jiangella anatolica]|uniref:Uncharacterized protein n=1 Tax=Jiangella anatolica TaxID=2670374 RepID=A0A2W2BUV9_9ACTN|nr:hypothetical protein [Jiangella anatolica]PZF84174.1 hypothetical protein C1I92_10005 [Jiangella anatolica]